MRTETLASLAKGFYTLGGKMHIPRVSPVLLVSMTIVASKSSGNRQWVIIENSRGIQTSLVS